MKFLLIATLFVSTAYAQESKEPSFEEMKQKISEKIEKKMSSLQTHKSCVEGAKDKAALTTCRESHRAEMKKMHGDKKEKRNRKK